MADVYIDSAGDGVSRSRLLPRLRAARITHVLPYVALIVVLCGALGARLYNVSWDDNQHLHPDERHITLTSVAIAFPSGPAQYFDTDTSPLNPYNRNVGSFVYGTFPLFGVKVVAKLLDRDSYDEVVLVGRHLAGLLDAATVLFVFLIGRRLYGSLAGLLASVLYAAAPLAIQQSHFWVADSYLTFFLAAGLFFCVRIAQDGKPLDYALAGLALGLGLASKLTALTLAPVIVAAAAVHLLPMLDVWRQQRRFPIERLNAPLIGLGLATILAIVAFRLAQPYAFVTPDLSEPASLLRLNHRWVQDQETQADLLSGSVAFPPSVQWIDCDSYIYPIVQMFTAGMGPVFAVLGWAALVFALYRIVWRRGLRHVIPVLFVLLYFGFMGRQFSLYLRYFLPLYPALAVLAGYLLVEAASWLARRSEQQGRLPLAFGGRALVALILLGAVLPGLAYLSIYSRPVTRIEASSWMLDNMPSGAVVASEHWDDALPLRLPDAPDKRIENVDLPLYELDTQEKVRTLIERLDRADYVVLSSNRLLISIPRNGVNYPVTTRYYDLLFSGDLGFDLVKEFSSPPSLLGVDFPDNQDEESWSSYDHPRVLIFQKTAVYSHEESERLLGRGPFATFGLSPSQADRNGLLLTPEDLRAQQQGGTWTDVFKTTGLAHTNPTLLWLLAVQATALAVLPLTLTLFRRLPDHGYLLSKPLGLLLVAYPVWLIVSLKLVTFEQSTILGVLVGLAAVGAVIAAVRWREVGGFFAQNWRLVLFCELLFLAAFFFCREVRMLNPDLWHPFRGGEKPMDFAYFTAITRSTTLPPYDPWLAGGYINYYYLGQFFTAVFTKLTAIPPEIAYNLAVPTYFAATAAGAFSVAYNLAAVVRRYMRRAPGFRPLPRWSLYCAGLLGVFVIALAGNLDGFGQFSDRLSAVSTYQVESGLPLVDSVANSAGGLWQVLIHGARLEPFDFWRPSRMMPPQISITEFPQFSFLFADLHAHMIAIPFEVLAVAIALGLALRPNDERNSLREWGLISLMAVTVGGLRWINSWDYPTFMLVGLGAIAIGERRLEGGLGSALFRGGSKAAVMVGLSFLFYKPFADNYAAPVSGLQDAVDVTPPHQFAAHFGVFLFILGVWLLFYLARAWKASPIAAPSRLFEPGPAGAEATKRFEAKQTWLAFAVGLAGVTLILALGLYVQGKELVAMLLPAMAVILALAVREVRLRRPDGGIRLFALMLVALGIGLAAGVDLITIEGDIERMNTVFKFYLHAWVLFALASSFAAWYLLAIAWRPRGASFAVKTWRGAAKVAFAVLLLGALIYPLAATPARVDDRFAALPASLDGTAYMQVATYQDQKGPIELSYDYEGIQWMRQNVEGTPTIVEGRAELYRWGGRFSIYTGLPAVVGWDWHQRQQRGDMAFLVTQRGEDVDRFYTTPDSDDAIDFLRKYGVRYVIVGRLEQLYYPAAGLSKFRNGLDGQLTEVYSNPELKIYRVSDAGAAGPAIP